MSKTLIITKEVSNMTKYVVEFTTGSPEVSVEAEHYRMNDFLVEFYIEPTKALAAYPKDRIKSITREG
jgi:hypothetical protein